MQNKPTLAWHACTFQKLHCIIQGKSNQENKPILNRQKTIINRSNVRKSQGATFGIKLQNNCRIHKG